MAAVQNQITQAGIFRLFLASMVIIDHASRFELGGIAVQTFFILSGFWVTAMWTGKYSRSPMPLLSFYSSRALRIWPLYLSALLAVSFSSLLITNPGHLPQELSLHNFALLGIANSNSDPLGVSWSLDIEVQFYITAPFLSILLTKYRDSKYLTLALAITLTLSGIALSQIIQLHTLFLYLGAFILGSYISISESYKTQPTSPTFAITSIVVFLTTTTIFVFLEATHPSATKDLVARTTIELAIAATSIPYIKYTLAKKSNLLDRTIGNIAYPLYLIHYPILHLTSVNFQNYSIYHKAIAITFSYLIAIFATISLDPLFERIRKSILLRIPSLLKRAPTLQ